MSRRLAIGLALAILLAPDGAGASAAAARRGPTARALSSHPLPANPGWRALVEGPTSADLRPVRVVSTTGDITDPQALIHPRAGAVTTINFQAGHTLPVLVLDYGKEVAGFARFDVSAATSTAMDVAYSEQLAHLTPTGDLSSSPATFSSGNPLRVDSFALGGAGIVTSRLIQGGERYERLMLERPGTVSLRSATIRFTAARVPAKSIRGHFLSSDRLLNRIWYAGTYTLNLDQVPPGTPVLPGAINRRHLIIDGAKRDRAVWSGDQLIADLTDYYASDPRYVRDSLELLGAHPASSAGVLIPAAGVESHPGPLPGVCSPDPAANPRCWSYSASYSIVFVPALYKYYLHTGDLAFVRREWASLTRQMAWARAQVDPSTGLLAVDGTDDADWNLERLPGELTYVNAFYYEALTGAARLAEAIGRTQQARTFQRSAAALRRAVNRRLWNPATDVFDPSTTSRGAIVQDANVTAIVAGLVSGPRARRIIESLSRTLATPFGPLSVSSPAPPGYTAIISPYMGSFQVEAAFLANRASTALSQIRTEWGWMVDHDPQGVDWERIQLDGTIDPVFSTAHAWSTGPTASLSQFVLGVAPAGPGYRRWSVRPTPGDLAWAQGVVRTPHGPLTVRWRRTRSHRCSFVVTVAAPAGTAGAVSLPTLGGRRSIAEDGRVVSAHAANGYVTLERVRGAHTFAWACGAT